jgi:hypothetical protein
VLSYRGEELREKPGVATGGGPIPGEWINAL